MSSDGNIDEREHFLYLVDIVAGRIIAESRSEASKFKKLIPRHHKHQNSNKKCQKVLIELRRSVIRGESLEWVTLQDPSRAFLKVSK